MANEFLSDLIGNGVAQLKGFRTQNVADAAAQTVVENTGNDGGALGAGNIGYTIYRVDLKKVAVWDGTQFVFQEVQIAGDIVFKGLINASLPLDDAGQPQPVEPVSGYEYVVTTAGTLTLTGVTFSPSAVVEVGDRVLFTSATQAYVVQRNDEQATETVLGNVRLATAAEVLTGTEALEAVTPATLQNKLVVQKYTKQYNATVNVTIGTTTITHNLGLIDRDAFVFNAMFGNSAVSFDVDSVDANSITVTSLVARTGVKVTVIGASAA